MALVDSGISHWPVPLPVGGNASLLLSAVALTFDSTSDRLAYVGRSPVTDSLTTVYFRTATVTTGSTLDVRIETVSNGRPTGTLWATNTNVTVVVADTDDNAWKTATLTAAASLTIEDEFAIVIVNSSGTPNMQLVSLPAGLGTGMNGGQYPLRLQDTGAGTWATVDGLEWICQFSTAGVVHMPGLFPVSGAGTITSFNSGTSPNERALRFQVPFACRARGIRVPIFNVAAGANFTISLWDSAGDVDGEALAQVSMDGDFAISTTADGYVDVFFSPVTVSINTTYYIGVRADTANSLGVGEIANSTISNALRALPGVNAQTYLATRTWTAGTAGAWSTTTTTLLLAHLIIDQHDDGAGSGGLAAVPLGGFVR